MNFEEVSLNNIKGISENRERCLTKMGIVSLLDIISLFPVRYENRTVFKKIKETNSGETVTLKIKIESINKRRINPKLNVTNIIAYDETGHISLVFFNRDYSVGTLKENEEYTVYGKTELQYGHLVMKQPQFVKSQNTSFFDSYIPVYPLTKGLTQNVMRTIIKNALNYASSEWEETLPFWMRQKYVLCEKMYAYENIHFPKNEDCLAGASQRIAFEEIFYTVLGLKLIKNNSDSKNGIVFKDFKIAETLAGKLPFELTKAQKKVIREICIDFKNKKRVNRLIQGDVGSGKTVVAAMAMLIAVNSGYQASIMAPTEILAKQHYSQMKEYFDMFGFETVLIVSGMKAKEKRESLEKIKSGEAKIAVGTNALLTDKVEFKNLGICVTDEQHRFGVNQRSELGKKGENVHSIVMTATPIPRSLALIIYGDMDVSIIDELPKNRLKVITKVIDEEKKSEVYDFIKKELDKGNKAFVVCPLIEESEALDVKNATDVWKKLSTEDFSGYKVGLLHGRMKSEEKDVVMNDFYNDKYDILVSTTVIEVGINIPKATVMMIENADRFGLACLHQLRGRVGRSHRQSYCFLGVEEKKNSKRLKIMEQTNDGFKVSEEDLKNRGPGEFFGTRQSGSINVRLQNISYDLKTVNKAKDAANELCRIDPELKDYENRYINKKIKNMFGKYGLTI